MAEFLGDVILEKVDDEFYKFRGVLTYRNESISVSIRNGLKTNGASIPKFAWSIIGSPLTGKYVKSALIHDGLYATHMLSKEQSDLLFLEMMKEEGVSFWKRQIMYQSVKYGGYNAYHGKTKNFIHRMKKFVKVNHNT